MATSFRNEGNGEVVFLIVPLPIQSHLNQFLRLSHLICSRGFPVHYAASVIHCRQVKLRHDIDLDTSGIIFHELPTPVFPSPHPSCSSSSSFNFPKHLRPSIVASMDLRESVAALLHQLSSTRTRRLVIIHDPLMSYAVQDSASLPNAESYSFLCASAFFKFCIACQFSGKPFPIQVNSEAIPTLDNCFIPEILEFVNIQTQFDHISRAEIINTCPPMEIPYLDFLAEKKKQWAIAPLFPVRPNHNHINSHPTLEWLDNQPLKSVLYVSFGSITSICHEQIQELALGLEQSKQRFLWVLRDADRGDIFEGETKLVQLPEGFEERVKGVGKVTRDWAPQLGILRHPSVGGFMSHCGWNSCLESLAMGVPLATWPMHSDQPYNALLITDMLKVGVPVIGWGERNQLVTSSTIKKSIVGLMISSEGDAVRKRAEDLGEIIKQSVDNDNWELTSFLSYAAR